jgi:parallel beta-helix repeat protein
MWGVVCINELYKMPFVIEICQDEDFLKYTHKGIGTEEDPFIIEDEHIGGSETSGIKIENTTKYFEIRNCQIEVDTTGIFIQNIETGTARISENICKGGMIGIKVKNADSSIIDNNICKNNYDTGIVLESSEKCVILNNSCQENELGIHFK